jgi:tRNA (mo5U34)-methyltransferase
MRIDYERFFARDTFLTEFHPILREKVDTLVRQHGRAAEWDAVLDAVNVEEAALVLDRDVISAGNAAINHEAALKSLLPWRKGPFRIGSTHVDTEWRSDWKWQRIRPHISPLTDRHVLDIGCGNGYHLFRMLGDGARLALGIDPTILFNYQFSLIQKLSGNNDAYLLPLRGEHLPAFGCFDTVFSMGVLYHRRSPVDHLTELFSFLRPGGELVLETLVVEGDDQTLLVPEDRYAKMANVWFIPSTATLETLLSRSGFANPRTVDVTVTTTDEQRTTEWMQFQSLSDFLDPNDSTRTVEGYPAPTRATVIAERPLS